MKFFTTNQVRQLDKYTIDHEPIASIDLMERAAEALYFGFISHFPTIQNICIWAGQGNNGGDALALARMLLKSDYDVSVILIHSDSLSTDCETNKQRLIAEFPNSLKEMTNQFIAPEISADTIIVDGLFGSGLSRPLSGIYAEAVEWMNRTENIIVAIDVPSGLQGEENKLIDQAIIIKANLTLSLQFPKLAFLLPENAPYVGNCELLDIGIHPDAIKEAKSNLYYLEQKDIKPLLKKRSKFAHKGNFGHVLIVAGCKGMAGASVLSSEAALRTGAGLATVHGPESNRVIIQTAIPEVIFRSDKELDYISEVMDIDKFEAIAVGPGIGTKPQTAKMLRKLLQDMTKPCILDADALNIIARENDLLEIIPKFSILTPHPKEFERIFGESKTSYERIIKAQEVANQYQLIIVLKGAYSLIAMPDSTLYFNSTGNSGMATAGSGDVLTGILAGLLAQGYSSEDSAKIGVFLHGQAGDLALKKESAEYIIASDIIKKLGRAYKTINQTRTN